MHLQRRPHRPIRVAPIRPRLGTPPRIHERNRLRHVLRAKHLSQDVEDLVLGRLVVLLLHDVRLRSDDGDEDDAAARQEAGAVEGLEDGVVTALGGGGVEEELGGRVPEDLVGGELQEDFGVGAHLEGGDGELLPGGEGRGEGDGVVLEDAEAERALAVSLARKLFVLGVRTKRCRWHIRL